MIGVWDESQKQIVNPDERQQFPTLAGDANYDDAAPERKSDLWENSLVDWWQTWINGCTVDLQKNPDNATARERLEYCTQQRDAIMARIRKQIPDVRAIRKFADVLSAIEVPDCQSEEIGAMAASLRYRLHEMAERCRKVKAD